MIFAATPAAEAARAVRSFSYLPFELAPFAETLVSLIELVSIGILVVGALVAGVFYLRSLLRKAEPGQAFEGLRRNLGRSILLGLELLVIADIINTIAVQPSFRSLGILGVLVVIRTFLSFALEVEIKGRLPWRSRDEGG